MTITVTQEDREASEEWRLDLDPGMRSLLAVAFARHRQSTELAMFEAVKEACAGVARDCAIYDGESLTNSDIRATCAQAIRALTIDDVRKGVGR